MKPITETLARSVDQVQLLQHETLAHSVEPSSATAAWNSGTQRGPSSAAAA